MLPRLGLAYAYASVPTPVATLLRCSQGGGAQPAIDHCTVMCCRLPTEGRPVISSSEGITDRHPVSQCGRMRNAPER